jgi:hypothetical protein
MTTARRIAWPAYLVSALLIAAPFADASTNIFPWHPGDARWRFGAIGVFTNASILPVLGVLLLLAVAVGAGHRGFRKVLSVVAFVVAAAGILATGLFVLDALQTQSAVRPELRLSFAVAAITAGVKLLVTSVIMLAIGLSARVGRDERAEAKTKRPGSEPLLWSAASRAPVLK